MTSHSRATDKVSELIDYAVARLMLRSQRDARFFQLRLSHADRCDLWAEETTMRRVRITADSTLYLGMLVKVTRGDSIVFVDGEPDRWMEKIG